MATAQLVTRAPGKAMLVGEYAVLDGAPAVVAAVDCYAVARLLPGEPGSPFITAAVSEAAQALAELGVAARPPAGLVPVVDTQSFSVGGRKLGVGSSASATVAAVGALLAAAGVAVGERPSQRVVQRAATRAHDAAQGVRGSGADVLAATFGGLCVLNAPEPTWDPLAGAAAVPLPAELCFVATTTSVSTAALVGRYREIGAAAQPGQQLLRAAAARFLAAWQGQDAGALLAAVEQAYAGYAALGAAMDRPLITADHARIAAAAQKVGGVAKPSGAGGGDLAVVFLPPGTAAAALLQALPPELPILNLHVSPLGLHSVEI
jgi:phosphomevalonate kinase